MQTVPVPLDEQQMSARARAALQAPKRRGRFRELDAARARQALLSVADSQGQARLYWLVDIQRQEVTDTRFLSFGSLASHPVMEAWSSACRGRPLDEALALPAATIEAALRDAPERPAFGDAGLAPLAFIAELQQLARAAVPHLVVPPEPVEIERYVRRREQDWDDYDRTWLPLSLMRKIMQVQQTGDAALQARLGQRIAWSIEGLHDDFHILVDFTKGDGSPLPPEQRPTVAAFLQEALRATIHPAIQVEEAGHA